MGGGNLIFVLFKEPLVPSGTISSWWWQLYTMIYRSISRVPSHKQTSATHRTCSGWCVTKPETVAHQSVSRRHYNVIECILKSNSLYPYLTLICIYVTCIVPFKNNKNIICLFRFNIHFYENLKFHFVSRKWWMQAENIINIFILKINMLGFPPISHK